MIFWFMVFLVYLAFCWMIFYFLALLIWAFQGLYFIYIFSRLLFSKSQNAICCFSLFGMSFCSIVGLTKKRPLFGDVFKPFCLVFLSKSKISFPENHGDSAADTESHPAFCFCEAEQAESKKRVDSARLLLDDGRIKVRGPKIHRNRRMYSIYVPGPGTEGPPPNGIPPHPQT